MDMSLGLVSCTQDCNFLQCSDPPSFNIIPSDLILLLDELEAAFLTRETKKKGIVFDVDDLVFVFTNSKRTYQAIGSAD